ncbi:MAG: hypothetical protein JWO30_1844 [Fibrobacteres bacterium]|nr:hypothetical protein [Fibrobacterota bacterium]
MMRSAATGLLLFLSLGTVSALPGFRYHPIPTPGFDRGNRETLLPVDIDKDGDLDFFTGGGRGSPSEWYENLGADGWKEHLVNDSNDTDVGAVALDVDGDGWMDKVAGSYWYRNPGHPRDTAFIACQDTAHAYVHDILAADIDGDGVQDIINIDYDGIRWFTVPRDSRCLPWVEHMVDGYRVDPPQHGGIAVGDIDGDGDLDISRIDRWFENDGGKGLKWIEHVNLDFGSVWENGWGLSGKARILDVDGDGKLDLIQTECDLPNGRVAWFKNMDGKGLSWERHLIKDSTDGQDFHTLAIADYDGDGDLDIFSMGGPTSQGTPKAYLWENLDGKGGSWKEWIVYEGKAGHEGAATDMDGDGDPDILLKPWITGERFYLENLLIPPASSISPRARLGRAKGKRPGMQRRPWDRVFPARGAAADAKGKRRGP